MQEKPSQKMANFINKPNRRVLSKPEEGKIDIHMCIIQINNFLNFQTDKIFINKLTIILYIYLNIYIISLYVYTNIYVCMYIL